MAHNERFEARTRLEQRSEVFLWGGSAGAAGQLVRSTDRHVGKIAEIEEGTCNRKDTVGGIVEAVGDIAGGESKAEGLGRQNHEIGYMVK
jgi:hypothetical protein